MRVGIGYDSHRFAAGRRLVLAGVEVPHHAGLAGHSDADVIAHAVTDALLGAAALGDIGTHFPPTNPQWQDADSLQLLQQAYHQVEELNYQILNVDVTVICEAPRLGPHTQAMRERLARTLGIGVQHVSVKVKSNEGMGWIGRGEGIGAIAIALLNTIDG
jgi:2-C-methyl-D-erythritol 2,4-cyclodiphosphate synthase